MMRHDSSERTLPLIITLGLSARAGGPVKTIQKFSEALNAPVFCFARQTETQVHEKTASFRKFVTPTRIPVLSKFCYAFPESRHELEKLCKSASILSCHSFYRYHAIWTHYSYVKFGTPYWHVPHGILDPYVLHKSALLKKAFLASGGRRFLDECACTIFATQREQEKAASVFGEFRGECVYWPVELVDQRISTEKRKEIRNSLGIDEQAKVLLYFGRIHQMKRPLETIRTIAQVASPKMYLVMLGPEDGVSVKDCEKEAEQAGFKNLRILPPVYHREKWNIVQACDAYISLSHRENFNHSAAESLAAGLPLILSEGNDLLHDMKGKGFTWTVRNTEKKSASEAIESFLAKSDEELAEMGRLGREWVSRNLSFDIFQRRLKELEKTYGRH